MRHLALKYLQFSVWFHKLSSSTVQTTSFVPQCLQFNKIKDMNMMGGGTEVSHTALYDNINVMVDITFLSNCIQMNPCSKAYLWRGNVKCLK